MVRALTLQLHRRCPLLRLQVPRFVIRLQVGDVHLAAIRTLDGERLPPRVITHMRDELAKALAMHSGHEEAHHSALCTRSAGTHAADEPSIPPAMRTAACQPSALRTTPITSAGTCARFCCQPGPACQRDDPRPVKSTVTRSPT